MRLDPSLARSTNTRIRDVVSGAKLTDRHTSMLPRTTPPGTACHTVPVQYCTVKSTGPYEENIIVDVGSLGVLYASCSEKTATSSIVFGPLKATSSQSGKLPVVASFQPPPLPQFTARRSPLIAPGGPYPLLAVDDAVATPPFAASATFTRTTALKIRNPE